MRLFKPQDEPGMQAGQLPIALRLILISHAVVLAIVVGLLMQQARLQPALEGQDIDPAWSPGGDQVVFVCYRREAALAEFGDPYYGPYTYGAYLQQICTIDINGDNRRQLTDDSAADYSPSWSPDGSSLLFVSERGTGDFNLFRMDVNGSNVVQLTDRARGYRVPRWSPDGSYISFIDGLSSDLFLMEATGGEPIRLTNTGGIVTYAWSPDSRHIAFSGGSISNHDIFVVDVVEGVTRWLADNSPEDRDPVWSPDSQRLLFQSEQGLYLVDVNTREMAELATPGEVIWGVNGSPDGRFVTYFGGVYPQQTLYILNLETGETQRYADFDSLQETPIWSPDSNALITLHAEDRNGDGFRESKLWVMRIQDGARWSLSE